MTQGAYEALYRIEEDLLARYDIDGHSELHDRISNILAQISVQRSLDSIVNLLREGKPLPVRRIGYNVKKLCSDSEGSTSRWQKITALEPEAWILCAVSFCKLASLPSSQFTWLMNNVHRYLEARRLPSRWIVSDQIRRLIVSLPRTEKTKMVLEAYHQFEMSSIISNGKGGNTERSSELPSPEGIHIERSSELPSRKRIHIESSSELPSPKRIHIEDQQSLPFTVPLTIEAAELVVTHLKEGWGGLDLTFPQPQIHPPYLIVPYHLCSKIMKTYTVQESRST